MTKTVDIKVTLYDEKEYIIENFQTIIFYEEEVIIIGEYQYEFKFKEIYKIEKYEVT